MGRIVFDAATSLNGWIADEAGALTWLFAVEGGEAPAEGLWPAGATVLVEGSTTYEWMLADQDLLTHPETWYALYGSPLLPRRVEADRLRLVSATAVGQFARLVYAVTPVG